MLGCIGILEFQPIGIEVSNEADNFCVVLCGKGFAILAFLQDYYYFIGYGLGLVRFGDNALGCLIALVPKYLKFGSAFEAWREGVGGIPQDQLEGVAGAFGLKFR